MRATLSHKFNNGSFYSAKPKAANHACKDVALQYPQSSTVIETVGVVILILIIYCFVFGNKRQLSL